MLHNTFCRRLAALVLTLAVAVSAVLPVFAVYPMPIQTATETEAVYLFNADTGKTLLTQNADQPRYVASLTKMMTALLLLESGKDLNGEVTVPTDLTQEFKDIQNANGTTMGLRIGETVRRIDLLNALLITSANDAASVIAWDVGGSLNAFIQQMTPVPQSWAVPVPPLPAPTACTITAMWPRQRTWQRSRRPARPTRPLRRWPVPPPIRWARRISTASSAPSAAPTR